MENLDKKEAAPKLKESKPCVKCGWLSMELDEETGMWQCFICRREVKFVKG